MREVATTLTDYLLALLSFAAFGALWHLPFRPRALGPPLFFAGFGAAALAGGTWHGFFSAETTQLHRLIWWVSLMFAGVAAAGLAVIGIELLGFRQRGMSIIGVGACLFFYGVLTWSDPRFSISLLATAAGTLVCILGLVYSARPRLALVGLAVSAVAAFAQHRRLALHPVHFDHNATYHLLLIPALGLFYAGLRQILAKRAR